MLKPSELCRIQALLDLIVRSANAHLDEGDLPAYIPELRKVDPNKLGIAVAAVDGAVLTAGDADECFSIQSISKVFTLTMALGKVGDTLWRRVGHADLWAV